MLESTTTTTSRHLALLLPDGGLHLSLRDDQVHLRYQGKECSLLRAKDQEQWAAILPGDVDVPALVTLVSAWAYHLGVQRVEARMPVSLPADALAYLFDQVGTLARDRWDPGLPFFQEKVRELLADRGRIATLAQHGWMVLLSVSTSQLKKAS